MLATVRHLGPSSWLALLPVGLVQHAVKVARLVEERGVKSHEREARRQAEPVLARVEGTGLWRGVGGAVELDGKRRFG